MASGDRNQHSVCTTAISKLLSSISLYLLLSSSISLLLTSCEYKDLCYNHNHYGDVNIRFNWEKVPDTRVGGMTVLFYNMDTPAVEPIRYDFAGMDGGQVRLLPGTYRAVTYNYDTETILYRGMGLYTTLEAYTRESSIEEGTQLTRSGMPRASNTEDQQVILEPDPLYGAASEPFSIAANGQCDVVLMPESRVHKLTINIINVPNLQYTSQFGGAISGLSPSVMMASGQLGEGVVTEAFTASVMGESTLEMHVRIFGHCPHAGEGELWPHILTIYAILADGTKWFYSIDVSDQMHKQSTDPDKPDEEIFITVDGLPVPKPIVNGSGFQPTIDGWQSVEIDVNMDDK